MSNDENFEYEEESLKSPVFYDPVGRRRRRVRGTWMSLAVVLTSLLGILITSVIVSPLLPQLNLPVPPGLPKKQDTVVKPQPLVLTRAEQRAARAVERLKKSEEGARIVPSKKPSEMKITPPPAKPALPRPMNSGTDAPPLSVGFYVNWDDSSYSSLKRNLNQLDWVMTEWIKLQDGPNSLSLEIDPKAIDLIRRERPQTIIIPLVQNFIQGVWNKDIVAKAIADDAARKRLIDALVQTVDVNKFGGACLDFEEVPKTSQSSLIQFTRDLHAAFQAHGWILSIAVPFDNPEWDYRTYSQLTDYLFLMGYDEHWGLSGAGPISSQPWFERMLAMRMSEVDPSRTILCLGSYGYNWSNFQGEIPEVSFQEAVLAARDSEADIQFDPQSLNPHFEYDEEDGSHHTVWFLDAVTMFNQIRHASRYRPAGYALWRLGSEDPSSWSIFGASAFKSPAIDGLKLIRYGYDVDFEGYGEILQVIAEPSDGSRTFKLDSESGLISEEVYTATPSGYVIRRAGDHPGLVALTFDDGPDEYWTPRILDVLKKEGVPATFFIIGQNGQTNPGIIKRIVAEGHDIGNHTYTHPNLGEISVRFTDLELNATQRLIESLTNRSTILFRAPYFGDAEPTTPDEVEPIVRARALGYFTIGLHIDPDDWESPGTGEIVKRTVDGITNRDLDKEKRGQIVLLHDGGGDRTQTLAALPEIIHQLRAKGYRFVTTSELMGMTQAQTMPTIPSGRGFLASADAIIFYGFSIAGRLLYFLFMLGIVLGMGRLIFVGALAFAQWIRSRRRHRLRMGDGCTPLVSIIVPAFNEERVIQKTVTSLLASDYPHFEIIVVDDGSTDRTSEVVRESFANEPRVTLYTRRNDGKAEALNYGLIRSQGDVIIGLDADTIFSPRTIGALARRFYDDRIGAVAGNAKVGNRINLVTRWQALEYITSQNLDRRAFASLNCITVVPGAVGAWRRSVLEQIGGFTSDTLAEDQDITLKVRKLGYLIGYEEDAIAWTEAPDSFRGLARQRFRWSYGTLQCMWKHRDALFHPRFGTLGFIGMPNVWIFQVLFPLVSPVMDLMLLWSVGSYAVERWEHPTEYAVTNIKQVIFYYALFLLIDWTAAAFAFLLEKREQWSLLWWLFLQRFGYRQIMYTVMMRSVSSAIHGALVGWGSLERKATVDMHS